MNSSDRMNAIKKNLSSFQSTVSEKYLEKRRKKEKKKVHFKKSFSRPFQRKTFKKFTYHLSV